MSRLELNELALTVDWCRLEWAIEMEDDDQVAQALEGFHMDECDRVMDI